MSEITIDDLGAMIKEGFDSVSSEFSGISKRLDQLESEINHTRHDSHDDYRRLDAKIDRVNEEVQSIKTMINEDNMAFVETIEKLERRIHVVEKQLKSA